MTYETTNGIMMSVSIDENSLEHHGILGQKWGVRRFQNEDGSLTPEGEKRYAKSSKKLLFPADYRSIRDVITNSNHPDDYKQSLYDDLELFRRMTDSNNGMIIALTTLGAIGGVGATLATGNPELGSTIGRIATIPYLAERASTLHKGGEGSRRIKEFLESENKGYLLNRHSAEYKRSGTIGVALVTNNPHGGKA